jgi:hypothetical protein
VGALPIATLDQKKRHRHGKISDLREARWLWGRGQVQIRSNAEIRLIFGVQPHCGYIKKSGIIHAIGLPRPGLLEWIVLLSGSIVEIRPCDWTR